MSFKNELIQRLSLGIFDVAARTAAAALDGDPNTKARDVLTDAARRETTGEGVVIPASIQAAFDALDTSSLFGDREAEAEAHIAQAVKIALEYQGKKI